MNRIIYRAAVIAALSLSASLWGCEKERDDDDDSLRAELQLVESVLPPHWSAKVNGSTIQVTRDAPLLMYHPILNGWSPEDGRAYAVRVDDWFYLPGAADGGAKARTRREIEGRVYDEEITLALEDPPGKQTFHLANDRPAAVRGDFWCAHETIGFAVAFGARLSLEEYEKRRQSNAAVSAQLTELETAIQTAGIARKFGQYFPQSDDQRALLQRYRETRERFESLPTHYSNRHSVLINYSTDPLAVPVDERLAWECRSVLSALPHLYDSYTNNADDQNRELSRAIRELAERCTPAVGSARAEVERVFGAGRAGFPDDVKLSKADRARGPDAAGRFWRYALGEDELRVTYDAATRSVVERAEYFDPNRVNGRAEAPTADETHAELVQRLAQMRRIAAAFEQRARR